MDNFLTPQDLRRRRIGLVLIGSATSMVVVGLTLLRATLDGIVYIIYWMTCYFLAGFSLLLAFWDMSVMRRRLKSAMNEIETENQNSTRTKLD